MAAGRISLGRGGRHGVLCRPKGRYVHASHDAGAIATRANRDGIEGAGLSGAGEVIGAEGTAMLNHDTRVRDEFTRQAEPVSASRSLTDSGLTQRFVDALGEAAQGSVL